MAQFTILITTRNRLEDLKYTLQINEAKLGDSDVEYIICDDGSNDGTYDYVSSNYPKIKLLRNETSKGLIYCRNQMMNLVKTAYAISIDDDSHFVTNNPIPSIEAYFNAHPRCAVVGFRIFWGKEMPFVNINQEKPSIMKSYVGCGHVFRINAWNSIPDYPDWFIFYGEEDFASYHLFKKEWEVHYLPDVLVHHRVDLKGRKHSKDYRLRIRRALRSGWFLYLLFYPVGLVPKKILYSLWMQFKTKVFKGDFRAFIAILQALGDLILNVPRLIKKSDRLSNEEFKKYSKLPAAKLYWKPKDL